MGQDQLDGLSWEPARTPVPAMGHINETKPSVRQRAEDQLR